MASIGMIRRAWGTVVNGFRDVNGNAWIRITPTASAVNDFTITNAATGTSPLLQASGSDTNISLHAASKGTGNIRWRTNTTEDRWVAVQAAKTIVDGSATSLFSVAIAAAASIGGLIQYHVFASDGTDHQGLSGLVTYAAVNKAGTTTRTITEVAGNQAKAVSSGTLTLAWTMTDDTNVTTIKLQPTGSLTETAFTVTYTVVPLKGLVTVL